MHTTPHNHAEAPIAGAAVATHQGRWPRTTQWLAWAGVVWGAAVATAAIAQTAPSPAEVARYTGLHKAAHTGQTPPTSSLQGPALNNRDSNGRTPLHVATFARQRGMVRALAQAGADLGALDKDRYDAVTIAAVANDEETLRLLLSLGASAKLVTSRYDGTALIAAAHLGHAGVVKQLIAAGAPLDHVNNLHWTAAIEAVVLGDGGPAHQETLTALVKAGANLQLTDRHGQTPLQLAKTRGYAAMVQLLERAGVSAPPAHQHNTQGHTRQGP